MKIDSRITYSTGFASKAVADAIIAEDIERKVLDACEAPRAEYVGGSRPWIITVEQLP